METVFGSWMGGQERNHRTRKAWLEEMELIRGRTIESPGGKNTSLNPELNQIVNSVELNISKDCLKWEVRIGFSNTKLTDNYGNDIVLKNQNQVSKFLIKNK